MYQNPAGPGVASAGVGGLAFMLDSPLLWALFVALALFTLMNAFGAVVFRVLPAGLTERPRAALLHLLGRDQSPRTQAKRYDFANRGH